MQLIVDSSTKKERHSICKGCEHLTIGFCGTPIIGTILEDGTRLCGCNMASKTRLAFARCPLGKWPTKLTDEQMTALLELTSKSVLKGDEVKEMWKMYTKLIGNSPKSGTTCTPCVAAALRELRELL